MALEQATPEQIEGHEAAGDDEADRPGLARGDDRVGDRHGES
jgi:hypothetical protein